MPWKNARKFIFERVAKRHVANVMEQCRCADDLREPSPFGLMGGDIVWKISICRYLPEPRRDVAAWMFQTESLVILHDAPKDGAANKVGADRVLQSSVDSSAIDEVRKTELPQSCQALEFWGVNDCNRERA